MIYINKKINKNTYYVESNLQLHVTACGCPLVTLSVSQLNITTGLTVSYCEERPPRFTEQNYLPGSHSCVGFYLI